MLKQVTFEDFKEDGSLDYRTAPGYWLPAKCPGVPHESVWNKVRLHPEGLTYFDAVTGLLDTVRLRTKPSDRDYREIDAFKRMFQNGRRTLVMPPKEEHWYVDDLTSGMRGLAEIFMCKDCGDYECAIRILTNDGYTGRCATCFHKYNTCRN